MNTSRSWFFFILLCCLSLLGALWLRSGTEADFFAALLNFQQRFIPAGTQSREDDLTADAFGVISAPSGEFAIVGRGTAHNGRISGASEADHTAADQQVCGRPPTQPRSHASSQTVYKWTDDEGQTHMSDQRPKDHMATVVDLGPRKQDFTYKIVPEGVHLPLDFEGQISAGSKRMYDTWHFFLGEENLRQSNITVRLVGNAERFNSLRGKGASTGNPVNGFYTMGTNQAVVKFNSDNIGQTLGTTFHEISHLITASHLGPTPPWLTEGLAEYFETMQVIDQSATIYPNPHHINRLHSAPLPGLATYLAIERPEWHGEYQDRNYAIAWSLIYFLMGDSAGMYALQETMRQAQQSFCKPFSAAVALSKSYPGGLPQLETDWRKWLASGDFPVHQI